MDNKEIYKKTLGFSIRRLLWDIVAFVLLAGISIGGFFLAEKINSKGLIGLGIALVVGIIALIFFLRYISYTYKAGQIAMMTKAVTEDSLPEDVIGEGKRVVKERFTTVAVYFACTSVIKGIFNQIGRGITALGNAIGGDTGSTIGSAVSTVIQTIVRYLCDCCLGWVFFRKEVSSGKATCEGAVLFFKHGKTFAKNMGRVFGIGLASFVVIGGAFTGVFYAIFSSTPKWFETLATEIATEVENASATLTNPATLMIVCAVLAAIVLWSLIHETFVKPFVLVGVLRNYMQSGMNDIPDESSFSALDSKSAKFKKLHSEI